MLAAQFDSSLGKATRQFSFSNYHAPISRTTRVKWSCDLGIQIDTSVCSSTDRASDYGSEGWGFESLQAHTFGKP